MSHIPTSPHLPPASFRADLETPSADAHATTGSGANHLATADKTASAASLCADIFMKKGMPKMAAQLFLSKVGMFSNAYSSVQSFKKGDNMQAGISLAKTVAALGMGRIYNLADGLGNAEQAYRHYQSGDFESATLSGAKLLLNVGATFSPPVAIASAVFQVGIEMTKKGV